MELEAMALAENLTVSIEASAMNAAARETFVRHTPFTQLQECNAPLPFRKTKWKG